MEIGIITFHFVHNQGGILQCLALQRVLEEMGHDVSVIDYRPRYHSVRYSAHKDPILYTRHFWKKFHYHNIARRIYLTVRSFMRCLVMNIVGIDRNLDTLINSYLESNLRFTERYTSLKQLQTSPPQMDAYISGSDQLWNEELTNHQYDHAYFLKFGGPNTLRITYAVSQGKEPTQKETIELGSLCKDLDYISLREYSAATVNAIRRDVQICLDPTLLLDQQDYQAIETQHTQGTPYIFVYGFETNDDILAALNMAVHKYRCKIVNGSPGRVKVQGDVKNIRNYAPDRFLTLIKNAECVITSSFHGTAFSIIYNKKFISVPHSTRGKRMTELLVKLELNCCLWGDSDFSFEEEIDYDHAYNRLQDLRDDSLAYLTTALRKIE